MLNVNTKDIWQEILNHHFRFKFTVDVDNKTLTVRTYNIYGKLLLRAFVAGKKEADDTTYSITIETDCNGIAKSIDDVAIRNPQSGKLIDNKPALGRNDYVEVVFNDVTINHNVIPENDYIDWSPVGSDMELDILIKSERKYDIKLDETYRLMAKLVK